MGLISSPFKYSLGKVFNYYKQMTFTWVHTARWKQRNNKTLTCRLTHHQATEKTDRHTAQPQTQSTATDPQNSQHYIKFTHDDLTDWLANKKRGITKHGHPEHHFFTSQQQRTAIHSVGTNPQQTAQHLLNSYLSDWLINSLTAPYQKKRRIEQHEDRHTATHSNTHKEWHPRERETIA